MKIVFYLKTKSKKKIRFEENKWRSTFIIPFPNISEMVFIENVLKNDKNKDQRSHNKVTQVHVISINE